MPTFYGYARIPDDTGAESGCGIEEQEALVNAQFQKALTAHSDLTQGETFADLNVSAWKHSLYQRPEGCKLLNALREGDHVCFAALDYGFPDVRYFARYLREWDELGVTAHLCDLDADLSTDAGRMIAQAAAVYAGLESSHLADRPDGELMALFAEWESRVKSRRVRAAFKAKRARGQVVLTGGRGKRIGYRVVKAKGRKILVPDRKQLAVFRWVYYLRWHLKWGQTRIWDHVEAILAKRENRKPITRGGWYDFRKKKLIHRRYDKWLIHNILARHEEFCPGRYHDPPTRIAVNQHRRL